MSNTTDALAGADLRSIPLSEITVGDGFNPRSSFDAKALEDLTASVRQHGVLAPITVCSLEEGYRLIAGERRLRAAHNAGLGEIPALVRPVDTGLDGLDLALVENIAREDLDAVEEARAFQRLIDGGLTRKGVAERLSIAQKRVTERLAVLELPQALHAKVADGSIAPGAIRALVSLGKVHAELPQFAVAKIEAGPAREWDEPLTYADLAEDPIRVVASDYEGEEAGLPAGVFETYSSYPIASFTLDEKAEGNLVKLAELRGFEPADFSVRFDRAELEAAEALGAAHQSKESFVGLIVGQEVADQLAADTIARTLKDERARRRRQREWEQGNGGGAQSTDDDPAQAPPTEEELKEERRREREAQQEERRAAAAFNAELGVAVVKGLAKLKVDERVVKVLAAVNVGSDLDGIAMRGARLGFPGWRHDSETKGGKPKVEYLDRGAAGAKAREYLAVAKSTSEVAGRLLALMTMARYADEQAVANSNRSFYWLRPGSSLPWNEDVLGLIDDLAAERLPEHLTADVRGREAEQRAEREEQRRREAELAERVERVEELSSGERQQLVADAEEIDPYSPGKFALRRHVQELEQQAAEPAGPEQPEQEVATEE